MRTVRETREERYERFARPLVRAAGQRPWHMVAPILAPALMGGVWALPAPHTAR